jgi:hypothetical protein
MKTRFLFDAAQRYGRDAGLEVVSVCHAALPVGVPLRDHYGNYVNAFTVYVGAAGSPEYHCAYGRVVNSIHTLATPTVADALHDIAQAIDVVQEFSCRAEYEEYFLGGCRGVTDIDAMRVAWRDYQQTANRAQRCLPADLFAMLPTLWVGRSNG